MCNFRCYVLLVYNMKISSVAILICVSSVLCDSTSINTIEDSNQNIKSDKSDIKRLDKAKKLLKKGRQDDARIKSKKLKTGNFIVTSGFATTKL